MVWHFKDTWRDFHPFGTYSRIFSQSKRDLRTILVWPGISEIVQRWKTNETTFSCLVLSHPMVKIVESIIKKITIYRPDSMPKKTKACCKHTKPLTHICSKQLKSFVYQSINILFFLINSIWWVLCIKAIESIIPQI